MRYLRSRLVLEDDHGVAEGVEAVIFGDSELISFFDAVDTGEGGYKSEEASFREVEVSDEDIDGFEAVAWGDVEVSKAFEGMDDAVGV